MMAAYPTATLRLGIVLALSGVLAACAVQPNRPVQPAIVTALPEVAAVAPAPPVAAPEPAPWDRISASFVLPDCDHGPDVDARAASFTRHPRHFEAQLQQSLPLMLYVHQQLQEAGIPGEFVMLPMLESSYNPAEVSHRGDAGGMWQMMPQTARHHGLQVNRHYDGRRDPVASTDAAIRMLQSLHRQFDDWRVADMAYNAGPYAVAQALRRHPDLGSGPIPDLPVSPAARRHLAKLLALACIIKDPARFHVTLPAPNDSHKLAVVQVPAGTLLADAADMAEITETRLRALNPGYIGRAVPAASPRRLLLPATAAQSLVAALTVQSAEPVAEVDSREPNGIPSGEPALPREPRPRIGALPPPVTAAAAYRVRAGDTLWSIAHDHHVSVDELKRWNHLDGNTVRSGEELRLQG